MHFSTLVKILPVLFLTWFGPVAVQADTIRLAHPGAPGSLYDVSADEFARRVNERLPADRQIAVEASPATGDAPELLDKVKAGEIALALVSSAMLSVSDRFGIFELPYLIRNRTQVRGLRKAVLEPFLQPAAKEKGFHVLGLWEHGFHHIVNDLQPVSRPKGFNAVKIAVPDNGWREKVFRAFGAKPVPVPPDEITDALTNRDADGVDAPLIEIHARGLSETLRHLTLSDHLYTPAFLVADKTWLAGLPEGTREILVSEARQMDSWVQSKAIELESNLLDQLDLTMQVAHADLVAFKLISRGLYGEFIKTVPDGLNMIIAVQSISDVTAAN